MRLQFLEKYYRFFIKAICQDIPYCEELTAHARKKGTKYIRSIITQLRKRHDKLAKYMDAVEHATLQQVAMELVGFGVDLHIFSRLHHIQMSDTELQDIVDTIWDEIKQGVSEHHQHHHHHLGHTTRCSRGSRGFAKKKMAKSYDNDDDWSYGEILMGATAALIVGGAAITSLPGWATAASAVYANTGQALATAAPHIVSWGNWLSIPAVTAYGAEKLWNYGSTSEERVLPYDRGVVIAGHHHQPRR